MEFKEYSLSELSKGNKGTYGIGAAAVDYNPNLYTYLRITDIKEDGTLERANLKSVDDENADKYILKKGDIVFARTGNSTGKSYFYDGEIENLVYAGFLIKFSLDETKVNPQFIKYYTLTNEYKNWVKEVQTGSTRGNINEKMYGNMILKLPPREYQNKMVALLGKIDKKIESNNQLNDNLQELINSLYIKYFINFDEYCGEYKESDLGMIPENFEVNTLGNVITFSNGYGWNSKDMFDNSIENSYKIFKMGNINIGGGINKVKTKSWIKKDKANNLEQYISKKGDILMCMTDMKNSGNPLLGHTALIDKDEEFVINQRVGIIRCNKKLGYSYIYTLSNLKHFINDIRSRANSGVQVNLTTKGICDTLVLVPDDITLNKFQNVAEPLYEKIFNNNNENEVLEQLRDTLLPKLMNGEIDLDKIEI